MRSSNLRYIPEIDHLRLLAALLVFAYHFSHYFYGNWQPLPQASLLGPITEGHTGVSLFFVLSGFIFMTIASESDAINYRRFLRNRFLRIAPLFFVVFVVAISIGRDRFQATDLLYLLATNLGGAPTSWHFVTGPSWSISVEFTFYLIFPFLALFAKREGLNYLAKLLLLMLVIKVGAWFSSEASRLIFYSTLIGRFDQFVIGMACAMIYARRSGVLQRYGKWALLGSGLLTYGAICFQARFFSLQSAEAGSPFWIVWPTVEAALWGSFLVTYLAAGISLPGKLNRALAYGGTMSFSLYMWHALIIFIAFSLMGAATSPLMLLLLSIPVLLATVGIAWLSYTSIERPFLRMRSAYAKPIDITPVAGA